jgi:hypothetical protein
MTYNKLRLPEKNGELLCIPSLNLIPQLIKSNKEKIKAYKFTIGYDGFHEFRNRLREKVIKLSKQYISALAIKIPPLHPPLTKGGVADTIIQTGHQPVFCHPGIIIKNLILNKIGMMEGIDAINLIVDSDNFKEIAVNMPDYRDGIKIEKEILLSNQYPIPYEFSPPPSKESFDLFIENINNRLSHPLFKNLNDNFNRYLNKIRNSRKNFNTLSEFMTAIRRIYEEEIGSQYMEIPVSYICNTDEFLLFFLSIAIESERFASIYNSQLEIYRKGHKLRYPVNPFPNLSIEDKKIELPIWHFYKNPPHLHPLPGGERDWVRGRVFAKSKDDTVIICFEGMDSIEFKRKGLYDGIELIRKNNIKIRPKAIILTLFNRLFVSDAFIHGIGGAKYDIITDNIIRYFYNVEPPEFITASLTLYPKVDIPIENLQNKIRELEDRLRDMRYNPERYSKDKAMIKEKDYLISILKTGITDKKEASIKLSEINERIYEEIMPSVRNIEAEIQILKKQEEESDVIQRRDYPYFLFSPHEIMKTLHSD